MHVCKHTNGEGKGGGVQDCLFYYNREKRVQVQLRAPTKRNFPMKYQLGSEDLSRLIPLDLTAMNK